MPQVTTTAERPITPAQARIYHAWRTHPDKPRGMLAAELGVSVARVRQALTVVRTKMAGGQACP
jgi:hypothetical protein